MGKGGEASATVKSTSSASKHAADIVNSSSSILGGDGITTSTLTTTTPSKYYKWDEIRVHNVAPHDVWIVYQNKVYDVSNWYEHPGGAVIFTHAGDDMTDIFAAFHAPNSYKYMHRFCIGHVQLDDDNVDDVNKADEKKGDEDVDQQQQQKHQKDFERGYRELREQLIKMGMFQSNPWYYVYKCASNMSLWGLAVYLMMRSDSTFVHIASAILMGLFFQQCGWLAHDFLHHQVFQSNRKYGDYLGLYWGNLMQGYSVQWWKNKHNGHHAVPNLHNSTLDAQDGDPDIDTMPLLAWSIQQAQSYRQINAGKDSKFVQFMIRYQPYFYFPILLLARLSWLNESFKTAYGLGASSKNAAIELQKHGLRYPKLERLGIFLHYVWVGLYVTNFGRFSIPYSITLFLIMTCSCGLLLALVFGLGHNGMAVYDADRRPDFWNLQVTTTRNVIGGHGFPQCFVDWFCGGLQYQVDHHLFPTLPRHNLAKAHVHVASFCKHWDVRYHEADLVDGTMEVIRHLANVSHQFVLDFVQDGPAM